MRPKEEAEVLVAQVKNSLLEIDTRARDGHQTVDEGVLEALYEMASRAVVLDVESSDAFFLKGRLAIETSNISNRRYDETIELFSTAQNLAYPAQRAEMRHEAAEYLDSGASAFIFPGFVTDHGAQIKGLLEHLTSEDFVLLAKSTVEMFSQAHLWGGKLAPLEKAVTVAREVFACEGRKDRLGEKLVIDEITRVFFQTKLDEAAQVLPQLDPSTERETTLYSVSAPKNSFGKAAVWVIGGIVLSAVLVAGVIGGGAGAGAAKVACHNRVESALKAPSTAQFSSTVSKHNTREDDFLVEGTVDAENSFGAMVRSSFQCVVDTSGSSPRVTLNHLG